MTNLVEVAELFWRQQFPNPGDDASLKLAEVIATAKHEYAFALFRSSWELLKTSEFSVPGEIITTSPLKVSNGTADISQLAILSAIPNERWAISLTGCNGRYIKTTPERKDLVDKEDLPAPRYYIEGPNIKFPDGAHDKEVKFTYATKGDEINGEMPISDEMASMVRQALDKIYNKHVPEDKSANQNPDF